jgi:DNA-binding CsgD family transcriptional regulator
MMTNTTFRIHQNTIKKIIAPLKGNFDIDYFTYCRYKKDECEFISSDYDELNDFLKDSGSSLPLDISNSKKILEWRDFTSKEHLEQTKNVHQYNPNGVTFVLKHSENDAEHISLCSSNKNTDLMAQVNRQPSIINQIIPHIRNHVNFKKKKLLIFTRERNQIQKTAIDDTTSINEKIIPLTSREYVHGLNGPTYITQAEKKCLGFLLQLQTSKEIARSLNSSERTIEHHIANVRKKLGASTRHQLYQIISSNFISF